MTENPLSHLSNYNLILGSASPRRKELLSTIWQDFEVLCLNADESYPEHLKAGEISTYLAKKKALTYQNKLTECDILITADTIVWCDNQVLNKPNNFDDACQMLRKLSNSQHDVYTGVSVLHSNTGQINFYCKTSVWFTHLTDSEIQWYVEQYKPYDKAGGYGIQDWIGYIGIPRINGDYYNVMGLPVFELYSALLSIKKMN
jgi:septum formation protein